MHWYRIIAQISLLGLVVLASPIVVHEAAMPKKNWRELESALDRSTSRFPRSLRLTDATASRAPQDGPGEASDSSGYPTPHLSPASSGSISGYSWLMDRPPRLTLSPDLQLIAQLRASLPSRLAPPEPPLPPWLWWLEILEPVALDSGSSRRLGGSAGVSPHASETGSQGIPLALEQGLSPPSSPHGTVGSDRPTTVTFSPASHQFTPSHQPLSSSASSDGYSGSTLYSSASGGSLPSHYFSASGGSESESESAPSHHSISMPEEAPTEPPLDNAEVFDGNSKESMVKKLKIVAGVLMVGGTIASIVGSQLLEHRDYHIGSSPALQVPEVAQRPLETR